MTLKATQKAFAKAIMTPLTNSWRMDRRSEATANKIIAKNKRLTSFERLELYNKQYWFRLIDSLYDDFPGLRAIVGEKIFLAILNAYLAKYPSRSYSIRDLGENLPKFIGKTSLISKKMRLAAIDMARFEWAQIVAFDGATLGKKPLAKKATNPKKLKLKLQPYITLLKLAYPFDDFVIALRKEQRERSEASCERDRPRTAKSIKLPKKSCVYLAVHRFNNDLYYKRLDKAGFYILKELNKGMALEPALAKTSKMLTKEQKGKDGGAKTVQRWFSTWNELGWFG